MFRAFTFKSLASLSLIVAIACIGLCRYRMVGRQPIIVHNEVAWDEQAYLA
jgi:hypothetical protein